MKSNDEKRTEAIRLRTEQRMSLDSIRETLGVSKSTAAYWLKSHPLASDIIRARASEAAARTTEIVRARKPEPQRSKFHLAVGDRPLSRGEKANIAEAAVLFRATIHGFNVAGPVFDGAREDWLFSHPRLKNVLRVQVKWVRRKKAGQGEPVIKLVCRDGSNYRRYHRDEFDYIIGYDLYTDTAFVFSGLEVAHLKRTVSLKPSAAEAWAKFFDG